MDENVSQLPGPRLRQLRELKGLSLADLAKRSGSSPSALHRYESGWGGFELKTLVRLAAALGARLEIRLSPVIRSVPDRLTPKQLVRRLSPLFWDVDLTEQHLEENSDWILRRVLQFGNWEDVHLVRLHFGDRAIRRAASHRSMDARTRRFWDVVLGAGINES